MDHQEHRNEANRLLLRVIEAQPCGELAAKAKGLRGRIASRDPQAEQPDGPGAGLPDPCGHVATGLGIGAEYQEALRLHGQQAKTMHGPHRFRMAG